MRAVRVLLVGLGVGAATLLTMAPASAERQPTTSAPVSSTTERPKPSVTPGPSSTVTVSPSPAPSTAPSRQVPQRPSGGVQTGGGAPESSDGAALLVGGAGIVAGLGAFALRRRSVRGSD